MNAYSATHDSSSTATYSITHTQLLSLVSTLTGSNRGREDDDHPLPPGPWDPVVRLALESVLAFEPRAELARVFDGHTRSGSEARNIALAALAARHPEILDALGGGHSYGDTVSLNPQPLPPRAAFIQALARTVASRAELLQEISDAMRGEGDEHGIIIVSGYLARFADDYCGTVVKLKYPFPGPRPHWFTAEIGAGDRLMLAAQLMQIAGEAYSHGLRQGLQNAAARLAEAGVATLGQ